MPPPVQPAELLWRTVCKAASLDDLAAVVVSDLPAAVRPDALLILALEGDEPRLDVVGAAPRAAGRVLAKAAAALGDAGVVALRSWVLRGAPVLVAAGESPPRALQQLFRALPAGPWWALPLKGAGARHALALAAPGPRATAAKSVGALPVLLREPLAAAMAAHHQRAELDALRRAADADRQALLNRLGRDELVDGVVGAEGGLRSVMQRVEMVAGADVPVLILGETGSGKEVVARLLHARSRRAEAPFIRVNCGAIPPELMDSELFGHEKGSFTGAAARRLGWFERADGGTLLLDEIGELPKAAQVRLLRVLQDGVLQRVGGEAGVKVDVRIIAATHADLAAMVQAGEFREDLWYRLAVFPLLLPPLRDRRQDIPALVAMLVQRAARRFGFRPPPPRPEELAPLLDYAWPGNVRELGTVVDRAVLLGEGRSLEFAKALGLTAGAGAPARRTAAAAPRGSRPDVQPLVEVVTRHLEHALIVAGGRVEGPLGAASLLGLNPNTLRSKLRRYGIDPRAFRP